MSHVIGRGRYARETYPGRTGSGAEGGGAVLRFYGADAQASVAEAIYAANRAEASWGAFTQDDLLEEGALLVAPTAYALGSVTAKRVILGAGGPIVGDDPITYEVLQSTDNGVSWQPPGGGPPIVISYDPNESGDKIAAINQVVPLNALVAIRATYPTNYDPQGLDEVVLFAVDTA